ncbi:MAG: hypothetical protein LC792_24215 [Actinobacteria bacterium]|nr:hypothetical protein [Actinomycetota bacterium]
MFHRWLSRADNPIARAVAGVRAPIRRKLLAAFAAIVVLLMAIGGLGLRVLGESNDRVRERGLLQERITAYRTIQVDNLQLRALRDASFLPPTRETGCGASRPPSSSSPGS